MLKIPIAYNASVTRKLLPLIALVVTLVIGCPSQAAIIYDAVNDFSLASNPNGVWAYGRNSGAGGSFVPFTDSSSSSILHHWLNNPFAAGFPNYFPFVAKNQSGSTFVNATGLSVPVDVLYMAPGINLLSIVQFTAANSGQHTFSGEFLGLQQPFDRGGGFGLAPGPTVLVSAVLNGTSALIAATSLNAPSGSPGGNVPINVAVNLTAGDTVRFLVDSTQFFQAQGRSDLDIQGDSIGLRLTVTAPDQIDPTNPIPEPSTALLAIAGLLLAAGLRTRTPRG